MIVNELKIRQVYHSCTIQSVKEKLEVKYPFLLKGGFQVGDFVIITSREYGDYSNKLRYIKNIHPDDGGLNIWLNISHVREEYIRHATPAEIEIGHAL